VCGRNHTALVTTGGDIYTCGNGAADQLGYGEGNIIISNKPKPVKSLAEKIDVVEASCGPMLVAIITRTGHLYTWYV
jgi:alpha-tubulin suppressor-like RCC1 family protein